MTRVNLASCPASTKIIRVFKSGDFPRIYRLVVDLTICFIMKSIYKFYNRRPDTKSSDASSGSYDEISKDKTGIFSEVPVSISGDSKNSTDELIYEQEKELDVYSDHRLHRSRFKWFWQFSYFIDNFGEMRGIERTPPHKRLRTDIWYLTRLTGLWCGAALSIPTMTGFFLGPTLYNISFNASVSSGILGVLLGGVAAAYGVTMGPRTGLRGMMQARFFFGWWFSKFISLLNCLTLIGWLMINGNFGGQFLSAMTNESVSIEIGILILFLISLVLSTVGFKIMTSVDAFFIIPLFIAFLLCYICTGHTFDVMHHSKVTGIALNTAWVTNFGSTIGITSTYSPTASDYHLDMDQKLNRFVLFFVALGWILLPTIFAGVLGIGLASATLYNEDLLNVYNKFGGAGLIVEAMKRWHGGGKFICVLMYISLITNSSMTVYSFGLSFQTLAKPFARTPRYILAVLGGIIWYVLCAVGTSGWAQVVSNFMPMIGYWSMIYFTVMFIEMEWFRRRKDDEPAWSEYLNYAHFPYLWASVVAFGFGVAGVVIGMDQYYYVGRVARVIGPGCEIGTLLAIGFTAISYVPLRYLEVHLRKKKWDNGIMRP